MIVDKRYISELERLYRRKLLEKKITILLGEEGLEQEETLEKFVYFLKEKNVICIDLSYTPGTMPLSAVWKVLEEYTNISKLYMENIMRDSSEYMEFLFSIIIDFCKKGKEILFYSKNIMTSNSLLQVFIENIFEYILPEYKTMFVCCNYIDKKSSQEIMVLLSSNSYCINEILFSRWESPELEKLFLEYFNNQIKIKPEFLKPIISAALGNPKRLKEIIRNLITENIITKKGDIYVCDSYNSKVLYDPMEKYIMNRYRRLDKDLQRIIRGASVLGVEFQADLLEYPLKFKDTELRLHEIERLSNIIYRKIDLSYNFFNSETHLSIKKIVGGDEYDRWCTSLAEYYYAKSKSYLIKGNGISGCNCLFSSAYYYEEATQYKQALFIYYKALSNLIAFMQYQQALEIISKIEHINTMSDIITNVSVKENLIAVKAWCLFSTFHFVEAVAEYEKCINTSNIDIQEHQKLCCQYAICLYNTGQIDVPHTILTNLYNEISLQEINEKNAELVVNILSNLSSIEETMQKPECSEHFNLALSYAHKFVLTDLYYSLLRKSFIVHSGVNYIRLLEAAKKYYKKIGAKKDYAMTVHNLASIHLLDGNMDKVKSNCNESIKIFREIGSDAIHYTYNCLGMYYCMQGDYDEALSYFRSAYKDRYEIFSKIVILLNQITVHIKLGNLMCAKQILKYIDELWRQDEAESFRILKPYYYIIKSVLYQNLNNIPKAYECYQEYLENEEELFSYRIVFVANKLHLLCSKNNLPFPTELKKYLKSENSIAMRLLKLDILPVHLMFAE